MEIVRKSELEEVDLHKNSYLLVSMTVYFLQAFQLLDVDGDGMVSPRDIRTLIHRVGGKMSEGEAMKLINKVKKIKMTSWG